MFETLGVELPLGLLGRFAVAFVIVLVLIGATFWLIRRFGNRQSNANATRGRQPRLGVIDVVEVEGRRLVLIRRDNVEHLILIGSSGDLVVEQNIVRAMPLTAAREVPVPRAAGAAEPIARTADSGAARSSELSPQWSEPRAEPAKRPEPAIRAEHAKRVEPPVRAEPRLDGRNEPTLRAPRPAEQKSPPAPEPVPRVAPEAELPPGRAGPVNNPMPRVVTEPMPVMEPRAPVATNEMELNDMAQRLETALRRSVPGQDERPEPAKATAGPAVEPRPSAPFGATAARETTRPESVRPPPDLTRPPPVEPPTRPSSAAPFGVPQARGEPSRGAPNESPRAPQAEPKPVSPKTVFDSLEQEMASLLGRPAGKD